VVAVVRRKSSARSSVSIEPRAESQMTLTVFEEGGRWWSHCCCCCEAVTAEAAVVAEAAARWR